MPADSAPASIGTESGDRCHSGAPLLRRWRRVVPPLRESGACPLHRSAADALHVLPEHAFPVSPRLALTDGSHGTLGLRCRLGFLRLFLRRRHGPGSARSKSAGRKRNEELKSNYAAGPSWLHLGRNRARPVGGAPCSKERLIARLLLVSAWCSSTSACRKQPAPPICPS